ISTAIGIRRHKIHFPNFRVRTREYASSNGISATPKYFVSAQAATERAEAARYIGLIGSRPSTQKITAHTHSASIRMSHITLLAETRTPGVSSASAAAVKGELVKRCANRYVPRTSASAGRKNPR